MRMTVKHGHLINRPTRSQTRKVGAIMPAKSKHFNSWWSLLLAILLLGSLVACAPGARSTLSPGKSATPVPRLTYVAIGASDAFGIGTDDPDRESWPTILSELLGAHVHLINLGIPGEVVSEARVMELPVALSANPDIITVWLAVNDLADGVSLVDYSRQLQSLLTSLALGTRAHIFVGNIPDLSLLPHFFGIDPGVLTAKVGQWNTAIATICRQMGVTLVDIHAAWADLADHPEYISSDGFHPSAAGARELAELFAKTISMAMAA
jgi:acyl-CoA thioesterase I